MKINYSVSLRKSIPLFLLAIFCLLSSAPQKSHAVLSSYRLTTGTGTKKIIAGSVLWSGYPRRTNLSSGAMSLGFNFSLDGNVYSTFQIYANGFVSLGSTQISSIQSPNIAATNVPVIAAWWGNYGISGGASSGMWSAGCGTNPTVSYQMIGSAPNRIMVVDYLYMNTVPQYQGEALSSFQIRIYETNIIELFYGHMTNTEVCGYRNGQNPATAESIGVTGGSNNYMSITPGTGTAATFSSTTANNSINMQQGKIPDNTLYTISKPPNVQLSASPKLLSFGVVQAGFSSSPLCVNVSQVGTQGTLTIASATITGSSDFTFSSIPATNNYNVGDPAGQYCIIFKPSQAGVRQAVLTITSNGVDSGLQTINLTGVGIIADMSVDSNIRFKKTRTKMGDSLTQYVHIKSTGQAPLFFSSFNITGIDAGQYRISYFPQNPLPVGVTDSLGFTYTPTIEGKHTATATIVSNSFTFPTFNISLQGTGILPHIVLTPTSLKFDSTAEGDTVCKTVDIWNPGTDTLRIKKNFLSSNDGDFHYTGLTGSDTAIAPDQHKTVSICFIPIQQGARQARLLLQTNIINTFETPRRDTASILTLDLTGDGVPLGVFGNAISGLPVLDSTLVGTSVCRFDTIMNKGDADILVSGVTIGGSNPTNFTQTGLTFPFLLKARSSKVFTICGDPDQPGLRTGLLTFTGTTGGRTIGLSTPLGVFGLKACISAIPQTLFTGVLLPNNGSDSIQCVKIINCGDIAATYKVTIGGASSADYSVTPAISAVIASKDTATFCVTYKPSAVGQSPASLNVTTADNSESVSVPLAGADGCATLTNVAPSVPNTMAFEKGKFTFTITNGGTYPWSPGTGAISGADASHFKVISVVPDPIPAGGQGVVTMEFDPTNAIAYTAKLTFPNGGPCEDAVVSVDLSGLGLVSSVKETVVDGFVLAQSYPNPSQGKVSFTYTTPKDAELSIKLVDMTGKTISTLISGRVSAGEHTVNFDASNLPSGTYIYLLESGSTKISRQLVLTK